MYKPLVVGATTLTLLFGGAGVANASTFDAPASHHHDDHDRAGSRAGRW